jgi:hypothetical protein
LNENLKKQGNEKEEKKNQGMSYSAHAHPSCPLVGFSHSQSTCAFELPLFFPIFQMFYILSLALPRRVSFIYQGNQTRGFIGKTLDIYYDEKNREWTRRGKKVFEILFL